MNPSVVLCAQAAFSALEVFAISYLGLMDSHKLSIMVEIESRFGELVKKWSQRSGVQLVI